VPDYAQVVGISTASAQKELIPLATIAVIFPLVIALYTSRSTGRLFSGHHSVRPLLAVFMSNAGGAGITPRNQLRMNLAIESQYREGFRTP